MARCGSGHLYRRVADRGNVGGVSDLFDREVEQPQRLVWLAPGLGTVDRVERLQHLVPVLGLVSSSTLEETKPAEPVWDESTGDEEYLTNDDFIYDSQPVYDVYGDEEWYSWFLGEGKHPLIADIIYNSTPVYDEYADEDWYSLFIHGDWNLSGKKLVKSGDGLDRYDIKMATVSDLSNLEVPIFQSLIMKSLNCDLNKIYNMGVKKNLQCGGPLVNILPMSNFSRYLFSLTIAFDSLVFGSFMEEVQHVEIDNGFFLFSPNQKPLGKSTTRLTSQLIFVNGSTKFWQWARLCSSIPFDPGDTSVKLDEITRETELCMWVVMIIMNVNRVTIPFDPGAFCSKSKLEDEFFEEGENDAGVSLFL